MESKKIKIKGFRKVKRIFFPILYAIFAGLGWLEASIPGLVGGVISGLLCSLIALLGIIPFVGIPLYL